MFILGVEVVVPRRLVEEAERRGLDINDLVVEAVIGVLNLDPEDAVEARLELAEKYFGEAREFIAKGDAVQASEKLYKVAEECIKALAEKYGLSQLSIVKRRGRWDTWLLGQAARDLAKMLGEEKIIHAWTGAYDIHVWGFHEGKYRVEDAEAALPAIEWLLNFCKERLTRHPKQ